MNLIDMQVMFDIQYVHAKRTGRSHTREIHVHEVFTSTHRPIQSVHEGMNVLPGL